MFTKLRKDKFHIMEESVPIRLFGFYIAFSPYRTVNTVHLSYKKQSVYAV